MDCTSAEVLNWDIERGAGYVKVSTADLVLDAGNASNFGVLRVSLSLELADDSSRLQSRVKDLKSKL